MSTNPFIVRLRTWATAFFDEMWRLIPAEPYLFPFFFLGGVISLVFPPAQGLLGPGPIFVLWSFGALVSPVMVLVAWHMVMHCSGIARYTGLWIRLGGDAGQFFVLALYLLARTNFPDLDTRGYGLTVQVGVTSFVLMLVARDLLALWIVEQLASKLFTEIRLNKEMSRARDAGP